MAFNTITIAPEFKNVALIGFLDGLIVKGVAGRLSQFTLP